MLPIPRTIRVRAALATIVVVATTGAIIIISGESGPRLGYIKLPVAGTQIVDKVAITVKCRAAGACSVVQFSVDGILIGAKKGAPYTITWYSTSVENGLHVLTAIVVASDGRTEEDTLPVNIWVANPDLANLWMDTDGGTCTRFAVPSKYIDGAACPSMNAAYQVSMPGDLVLIKSGTYPEQQIIKKPGE